MVCDEASMLATRDLVRLVLLLERADAKLVLVGDHHQLGAVEAGGLFRLLALDAKTAELTTIRRFNDPWEAGASRRVRDRDPSVIGEYDRRGRTAPAAATKLSTPPTRCGSTPARPAVRWWSWPPTTPPSTSSHSVPGPPASPPARSKRTASRSATRSSVSATRSSALSTTGDSSPARGGGCETVTAGRSWPVTATTPWHSRPLTGEAGSPSRATTYRATSPWRTRLRFTKVKA